MPEVGGGNYQFRTGYEDQVQAARDKLNTAQGGQTSAANQAQQLVNQLNAQFASRGLHADSLDQWKQLLQKPLPGENQYSFWQLHNRFADQQARMIAQAQITGAQASLTRFQNAVTDASKELTALQAKAAAAEGPLEAMKKLLESGDIEGAVMLLQTTRVQVLDAQLAQRIAALQQRNADIKALNDKLADAQKALAGDKDNGDKQKAVTQIKGQIDQLNSDSQLDMIGIQSLVNKRNEAFDLLSNLLNKFQKTVDGIVSNIR